MFHGFYLIIKQFIFQIIRGMQSQYSLTYVSNVIQYNAAVQYLTFEYVFIVPHLFERYQL